MKITQFPIVLVLFFFVKTTFLQAQTILRVNVNTPCTSGCNGSSWALAYPNVSNALASISGGASVEIWVAAGTYKPGTDRLNSFDLSNNTALYGGFHGTELSRSQRNPTTYPTILSGDMNGDDVGMSNNGENNYHVVTSYGKTGIVLDGFTIKGGNANVSATNDGGGFYCVEGQAVVNNCIFEYNYASYGGALNASISPSSNSSTTLNLTVSACTFRHNQGTWGPSLACHMYAGQFTGTIENCVFEYNSGGSGSSGGAIWETSGSTTKAASINNTIIGCTFKNNYAGYGGGLYASINNGTIQNTVKNCQFLNNSSSYGGAATLEGTNTFINCLFSKNTGTYGGAVRNPLNTSFTNCTFSGNTGTYGPCLYGSDATTSLTNSILWNQTSPIDNTAAVVNYCDVQGGWSSGTGNQNVDPQFTDVAADNYRLATSSPCRNVGSNAANSETTDLDGYSRVIGGTIDLGAYEGPSNSIGILIPDATFASAIHSVCPTCIDGLNYLTTVAAAQTSLNLSNRSLTNLTGIEGFSSLTTLNLSTNNLTSLPTLPNTITNLTLSSNQLTDLSNLPSGLTELRIDNNAITCLLPLPNSLSTFVYDVSDILCLPNKPSALTTSLPVCGQIISNPPATVFNSCANAINLTASATASSAMTVKWQRKGVGEADFSDLTAATSYTANTNTTYAFTPTTSDDAAYYRAVFTPMCPNVTTSSTQIFTANATTHTTNGSLNFDGSNDYVEIANCSGAALPISDALTIEFWFKGSNMQSAVRFQPDANTYIVMGWNNSKHIISTSGGTNGVNIGTGATDGNWHHVAMTWQKGSSLGFISYLDGARITRRAASSDNLPSIAAGMSLGSYNGTSEFMNGSIDEVRVWNVVRTQAEIQSSMCNLTLPQSGLLMYYQLNQGVADGTNTGRAIVNTSDATSYIGSLNNFALSGTSSNFSSSIPTNCPTVLPVELVDFSGEFIPPLGGIRGATEGGKNVLKWQTENEIGVSHFDIERSLDGRFFEKIGQVKAFNKNSFYQFIDENIFFKNYYYRLKINDLDGKSSLSKIISIERKAPFGGSGVVKIYPSVTSGFLTIENAKSFEIINSVGQVVLKETRSSGNFQSFPNLTHLPNGIYFVKGVDTEGGIFLEKIVKQ
jgi:hypothetical protein